ncbi:Slp family lipoprotein [Ignatzschineria larvae DSM 13226]|uniref:Slp family lipoprotein n=1 Tax=Ignatzschineria larvae DSM 13226 TaxID=1111732 RepID=A0ABZ3C3P5_9GAMM|nr:Slp family lipoprotein [Ignatzschineria larvae]
MWQRLLKISTFLLLAMGLGACASLNSGNISTNNPNAYGDGQLTMFNNKEIIGKEFMLGGSIVTINPQGDHIRVEVVLNTLDQNGYPMRNQPMDQYRMIADIYGPVRTNGYSAGDYFTAVGLVKQAENVKMGGETIRVITLNATDYDFWRDPRREVYYDEPFFNSPALRFGYYQPYWGVGFGPYFPYYY